MTVLALPANQPETFYAGAGRIAAFRSGPALPDRPEDWVASTTTRFGLAPSGLSALPDRRLLADAVAADPHWWLGPDRTDTGVLVKLLDAGQRLPLHAHPDRRFAHEHLASPYGKTEAWVIVEAVPDAYVHLGFARDVAPEELAGWVAGQRTEEMLAATNRVPIRAGDAVLCPAGLPHAIGPGVAALRGGGDRLLPAEADEFFAAERLRGPSADLGAAFSVVVVVGGAGTLAGEHDDLPVRRGDTLLVPYAAGRLTLTGDVEAIRLGPAAAM
jgi:mannose-6-phosphate isomerase